MQPQSIVAQQTVAQAERPVEQEEVEVVRWGLTLEGALVAATAAVADYIADPSMERGARMEARHALAWKIAERGGR